MHTTPSSFPSGKRALVLGGGGAAGNAWLIGVLAGMSESGSDVTDADLIVGTSAGATTAAQITGATPAELFSAILAASPPHRPAGGAGPMFDQLERTGRIIAASRDAADMRSRMGAAALEMAGAPDRSGSERWRAMVAGRLSRQDWPDRRLLVTAVDAETGEPVAFDRSSGVELVDAVAASTAGGPAYSIGNAWYIDGGYRSNADNADLAAGYERVLVLSPLGGRTRFPLEWGMHLEAQVDALRSGGSRVETVFPDADSLAAFGENMMDLSAREPAARAGYAQGTALAGKLTGLWR
ncbi:MAG: patatin-like phospholipase family protein [Schumannella sp.]|nr:patatin-like phospholipase family protein [Schumannella sp.]